MHIHIIQSHIRRQRAFKLIKRNNALDDSLVVWVAHDVTNQKLVRPYIIQLRN